MEELTRDEWLRRCADAFDNGMITNGSIDGLSMEFIERTEGFDMETQMMRLRYNQILGVLSGKMEAKDSLIGKARRDLGNIREKADLKK